MSTSSHTPPAPRALLVDTHGRRLSYLRLSITDRCNLRCTYCMPDGGVRLLPHEEVLRLEELSRVARVAVSLGVEKIRLTGGEPLVRKNLGALLTALDALEPRPDLRITTNGLLLADNLYRLHQARLSTVNVSMDTLRPERFGALTGLGLEEGIKAHAKAWRGIEAALEGRRLTVKLNVVLQAGQNDDEALDFARLSLTRPMAVRFIEYMPVGRRTLYRKERFFSSDQLRERLKPLGELTPLPRQDGDGPAQRFRLPGAMGELGVISALSSHFCDSCNRLRINAQGKVVPCLFAEPVADLKPLLRGGAGDDDLAQALLDAAAMKPRRHDQSVFNPVAEGCDMHCLGG